MKQRLRILTCLAVMSLTVPAQAQEEAKPQKPGINAFINYIWQTSPAIQEAEARVAAAAAGQKAASSWQHNPELEFEVEDVDGEDKTKLLGVSQTIDWSGKFRSSGKTAEFEWLAASADRDGVRQNIAVDVLAALADYRAAKDVFGLAAQRSSLMERFAGLAEKSFKAGDIDQSEYNLAQLALSEALIEQADAETTLAENRQDLDTAIGFPLENGFALPDLPGTLPELSDNGESEDGILMNLPAIRAMKSREEAAKSVITQANKDRLPDPTIGIVGGEDGGADMIGFSVSVPLHVFNTYGAEVDVAKQEAIAEAKAGQNAFHAAKTRLQASRRSYQLSRKAWENWQENGAQALAEQVDILDRKFKVGDLSATDYLVQIEQALDTEVAAKELHSKVWQSWFAWLAASGKTEQWIQNSGEQQ
ncbi:MAG: transporter [Micavibrio sp.]|nr:MAG: transporter [Micavibrio sp.]